ncbi:MAG: DNA-binding CsgD family transcriptional regulator, partial [Ilumatobacter sp.]
SAHTVKNHLRHAMTKLDAHTKLEAVVKAVRARLISIEDSADS